ncbi:hypothetical protein ACFX14_026142 [Malus domestica]
MQAVISSVVHDGFTLSLDHVLRIYQYFSSGNHMVRRSVTVESRYPTQWEHMIRAVISSVVHDGLTLILDHVLRIYQYFSSGTHMVRWSATVESRYPTQWTMIFLQAFANPLHVFLCHLIIHLLSQPTFSPTPDSFGLYH